jgi:integrase
MRDLRHEGAAAAPDLAAYIDFLDVEGKRPKTLYSYTREIAFLLREYPERFIEEFTEVEVNAVLAMKPARSRYITRSIFNGWFEWALAQDLIERSPMRKVAKPKAPPRRPSNIYTEAEVAALESLPSPDGALCAILFGAGLRKSEACKLQRKHIDLDRRRLWIIDGKGGKDGVVPISQSLAAAIADLDLLEGLKPDEFLWYMRPGGRGKVTRSKAMAASTFDRWWGGDPDRTGRLGVCEKAGVRRLNLHQTRHTYGHRLRESNIDLELRKVLMRHENIKTTDHYYGTVTVEDAAAALDEVWV